VAPEESVNRDNSNSTCRFDKFSVSVNINFFVWWINLFFKMDQKLKNHN